MKVIQTKPVKVDFAQVLLVAEPIVSSTIDFTARAKIIVAIKIIIKDYLK